MSGDTLPGAAAPLGEQARAPQNIAQGVYDITAGKAYPVIDPINDAFSIRDDAGYRIYCLWEGCAHLMGGNWTRVSAGEAASTGEAA